jgi:GntR family transcriptional regulator
MNPSTELDLVLQGGAPLSGQIKEQLRAWIVSGLLIPGEQLPSVRELAVGLAVNPQVVSQAYADLEREGFLTSEDGSGTFVAAPSRAGGIAAERRARLEQLCADFLTWVANQGFRFDEVLETTRELNQRRFLS